MSVAAPAPGVKPGDRPSSAPVYTEALGPSRTHRHRTLKWTPAGCGCGTAELVLGRASSVYRVRKFATRWVGRAFRFDKVDGSDTRDVFLSADGRGHRCDCEGFAYAAKARGDARRGDARRGDAVGDSLGCKHLDAARALVDNRWLDLPTAAAG